MEKKYELLTDKTIQVNGHTLYRIRALRDAVCGTMVNRGCFIGSLREFEIKVMARHDDNIHGIMYGHAIAMIKAAFA